MHLSLLACLHPVALAKLADPAAFAGGLAGVADAAAVEYEGVMHRDAVAGGNCLHERVFGLEDVRLLHQADAVGNAENVRVDGNALLPEGLRQHNVRGLAADAGKLCKQVVIAGHFAAVLFDQHG